MKMGDEDFTAALMGIQQKMIRHQRLTHWAIIIHALIALSAIVFMVIGAIMTENLTFMMWAFYMISLYLVYRLFAWGLQGILDMHTIQLLKRIGELL